MYAIKGPKQADLSVPKQDFWIKVCYFSLIPAAIGAKPPKTSNTPQMGRRPTTKEGYLT
jgi:hypothetical protein